MAGPLYIVLTAPMTEGTGLHYRFGWSRTVTPSSGSDTGVFSGSSPQIEFVMNVATPVENTPPELQLPADSTVEGNATGGAAAAYTVTATDAEDAVAPTPSCTPATGSLLPLGLNTISCTATDSANLSASGSFHITVVDTTDPVLHGMPGDVSLTTNDPDGTTLTYTPPTATDIVDDAPDVQCSPVSGSTIPVGDTTVTCTAVRCLRQHRERLVRRARDARRDPAAVGPEGSLGRSRRRVGRDRRERQPVDPGEGLADPRRDARPVRPRAADGRLLRRRRARSRRIRSTSSPTAAGWAMSTRAA